MTNTQLNCGACGEYYDTRTQAADGFHDAQLCSASDLESANTFGIKDIMSKIKDTAPAGAKVEWQYPGYVSIVLPSGVEIAFGESLESDTGYTWNCYELDGTNNIAGSFDDLKDTSLIVSKLWEQAAQLLNNKCQLCNELTDSGLPINAYGYCCSNCIEDVKEYGTSRILTDKGNN